MPSPLKPSSSKQHQRHSDASLLRNFMDRKSHNLNFLYTYPPYPSNPAAFSVNGIIYMAQPAATGENVGASVPHWNMYSDPRGVPNLHRQAAPHAQHEANGHQHTSAAADAAAAATSSSRNPPTNARTTTSPDNATSLVPSRPSSPMTIDAAIQSLNGHLHDAIQLCTESLAAHEKVVKGAKFASEATQNGMWRDLLEHRFRGSGFAREGFHNLGRRLKFYMDSAHLAAEQNVRAEGRRREAEQRARNCRMLRAKCAEVVGLTERAARDVLECKEMLGLMKEMKTTLAGFRGDGAQSKVQTKDGDQDKDEEDAKDEEKADEEKQDEGGNSDDAPTPSPW